jgi:cytidylate kinase
MNQIVPVITVDGPGGSGKGTVGHRLAKALNWHFLDSGALYRVLALAAQRHGIAFDNEPALEDLAKQLDVQFIGVDEDSTSRIILEGAEVTDAVRTEECGNIASKVSAFLGVRKALLTRQRDFQVVPGLIADGRDMGTVVFPDAPLKVFLLASPEERAARRYRQLKQKGINVSLKQIQDELRERDIRDKTRIVSPLKPAEDAVLIDTDGIGVDAIVEQVLSKWHARQNTL